MPELPSTTCTGCGTCAQICSVHAIDMRASSEGFLYPFIKADTCVGCNVCEKRCPVLHPPTAHSTQIETYGCINKNEQIRNDSSSGGVFSACAEYIIDTGGVVFGARFDADFSVVHGYAQTREELAAFRGSKYVQSTIGNAYADCKRFLESGRCVLFTGTPCQIGGLKAYLNKEYEQLYLMDMICHGVPSPLLWKKYVAYRAGQANSPVRRIAFRHKNCGWKRFSVAFSFENAAEYRATLDKDSYMRLFLRDVCLRESCYACSFKTEHRVSDITVADFWGVESVCPQLFDDKGTSLVLVQSEQGKKLFEAAAQTLTIQKVSLSEGIRSNPSLITSARRPKKRDSFFYELEEKPLEAVFRKYGRDTLCKRCYLFAKRCIRKLIGSKGTAAIKKLLGKG